MSLIDKLWMDKYAEGLFTFLNNFQQKLVSGINIKTINNVSLLGRGNITITSGGGGGTEGNNIYKAEVTVDELINTEWDSDIIDKIVELRANVNGNDLLILPVNDNSGDTTTYVSAVVLQNDTNFKMIFYISDSYYTILGDSSDNYTLSKQTFSTSDSTQHIISYFIETEEPGLYIVDQSGNIAIAYTSEGLDVALLSDNLLTNIDNGVNSLTYDIINN